MSIILLNSYFVLYLYVLDLCTFFRLALFKVYQAKRTTHLKIEHLLFVLFTLQTGYTFQDKRHNIYKMIKFMFSLRNKHIQKKNISIRIGLWIDYKGILLGMFPFRYIFQLILIKLCQIPKNDEKDLSIIFAPSGLGVKTFS